jgi:hypothetical protein
MSLIGILQICAWSGAPDPGGDSYGVGNKCE